MNDKLKTLRALIRDLLIGGVLVILPLSITYVFASWLLKSANKLISPLTSIFTDSFNLPAFFAIPIVIALLLIAAVMIGSAVRTRAGNWVYASIDTFLAEKIPGYKTIKEIVQQVFGNKEGSPFTSGEVARVQIFGPDTPTTVTALVMSKNSDDTFTIFVPTGPNPTSGQIFHVPSGQVQLLPDANVESMMRTILACGAGSNHLFHPPAS